MNKPGFFRTACIGAVFLTLAFMPGPAFDAPPGTVSPYEETAFALRETFEPYSGVWRIADPEAMADEVVNRINALRSAEETARAERLAAEAWQKSLQEVEEEKLALMLLVVDFQSGVVSVRSSDEPGKVHVSVSGRLRPHDIGSGPTWEFGRDGDHFMLSIREGRLILERNGMAAPLARAALPPQ